MTSKVKIYDTTLRDGSQSEGISYSAMDKIDILKKLDEFGMDFVEGGWPGSNPRDDEFFLKAGELELKHTSLVAFGSTGKHGVLPENDVNLKNLANCSAGWCCIFGKSWDFQVTDALCIPLEDNLEMIRDSVKFLKDSGKRVMFDAEHFFDGYKSNSEYAVKALSAAVEGGAEWLVLCDTNGGTLPEEIAEICDSVSKNFEVPLGIHCHNDSELAVANSLTSTDHGVTMIQGTVNGIGERCGNANLCSIIADLTLKKGHELSTCVERLTEVSQYIGEISNTVPPSNLPFVGEKAFAHKGGIHVSAVAKNSATYEHTSPESVGNTRRILISDMAGRASITEKLKDFGLTVSDSQSKEIADKIKELESKGYQFEGADASFELLVRRFRDDMKAPFKVLGFKISIDNIHGSNESEASIKIADEAGAVEHTAADGNGPVNALDNALRKALSKFFPQVNAVRLTDYKVRVIDEKSATAASVRVMVRSTDGKHSWTTVGVSEDVINASLVALTDSLEYAIFKSKGESE